MLIVLLSLALAAPPEVARAVGEALAQHPELAAAEAVLAAAEAQVRVAKRSWADPVLSVSGSNLPVDSWVLGDHPMTGVQIGLSQRFPTSGRVARAQAAAAAWAEVDAARVAEVRLRISTLTRQLLWRLADNAAQRHHMGQHLGRLRALLPSAESRVATGSLDRADQLALELRVSAVQDRLLWLEQGDGELRAALGVLLEQVPAPPALSAQAELSADSSQHPRHVVLAAESRAWEAELALVRAIGPDLTAEVAYRVRAPSNGGADDGTDFVSIGMRVPLPVATGLAARERAQAVLAQAQRVEAERAALTDRLRGQAQTAQVRHASSLERVALVRQERLPVAQDAFETAVVSYREGEGSLRAVITADETLLNLEHDLLHALLANRLAVVEHDEALGLIPEAP